MIGDNTVMGRIAGLASGLDTGDTPIGTPSSIVKIFKLKLNGNGTLYISPRALTHLLSYSLICLHNSLVFHLKLVPGFRAYFYFLGVGEGGGGVIQ